MKKLTSFNTKPTEETLILACRAKNYLSVPMEEIPNKNYVKTCAFFRQNLYFTPCVEGLDIIGILTEDEPIFLLFFEYGGARSQILQGMHQLQTNDTLIVAFNAMLERLSEPVKSRVSAVHFRLNFTGFLETLAGVRSCASYDSTLERVKLLDLIRTKPYAAQSVKLKLTPLRLLTASGSNILATNSFKPLDFDKLTEARLEGIKKVFVATDEQMYTLDLDLFFKINPLVLFVGRALKSLDKEFAQVELCDKGLHTLLSLNTPLNCEPYFIAEEKLHCGAHVRLSLGDSEVKIDWNSLDTKLPLTHLSVYAIKKLSELLQKTYACKKLL